MTVHVLYLMSLLALPLVSQAAVSAAEQAEFLKVHNDYRRALAKGQYGGPATDMQEVQWDADLAAGAQKWADTCARNHDSNSARQTASNKNSYVGQNAAWGYGTIAAAAKGWWDEYSCVVYSVKGGWPISSCNCAMCGHFTQMAWSATTHIGCGINTQCSMKTYFCNYYPGGNFDWGGRQDYVFRPGQACSNCAATGSNSQSCNDGLCSNEVAQPTNPVTPRPTTNPVSGPQPTARPVRPPTRNPVSTSVCPTDFYGLGYQFSWYTPLLNGNQRLVEDGWATIPYGKCFTKVVITYTPNKIQGWYDLIQVGGTDGYFRGTSNMMNDLKSNMAARKKTIEDYVKAHVAASGSANQGARPPAPAGSESCSPSPCGASASGSDSKKVDAGLVVGVVVGAIAACCLMAGVVYCIMQQHKKSSLYQNEERLLGEQNAYQPPVVS